MRYNLKCFFAIAVITTFFSAATNARADLLGYWPFEDTDGTVVADFSGNGNDGTASDTFAFTDDGFIGRAGDFGDFNNSAFVAIESAADGVFDSVVDTQQATVSFWMNRQGLPSASQWTYIFDGDGTGRQIASHAGWGGDNGTLYFDTGGCCDPDQRINKEMILADGTTPSIDGEWHHLAYVRDDTNTFVYINGELFHDSITQTGEDAITSPMAPIIQATIGANGAGANSQAGLIDEFAIWDEALPLGRIIALSEGQSPLGPQREPAGDFNADGVVTIDDFNILAANFGQRYPFEDAPDLGDINGDLRVDLKDFLAFRQSWNAPAGEAASVPEPSSIALIVLAMCGLTGLRRRRR